MDELNNSRKSERRHTDANDRKTFGSVLDKKTRGIIDKLHANGLLQSMHGPVCTGKEAAVYIGTASPDITSKMCGNGNICFEKKGGWGRQRGGLKTLAVAIKIYKTSAMVFRDRAKYIEGERRFRTYARGNSRKLVKLWAEKEVRNLNRLNSAGVPSPRPLFLRRNVLVMTMIGNEQMLINLDDAERYQDVGYGPNGGDSTYSEHSSTSSAEDCASTGSSGEYCSLCSSDTDYSDEKLDQILECPEIEGPEPGAAEFASPCVSFESNEETAEDSSDKNICRIYPRALEHRLLGPRVEYAPSGTASPVAVHAAGPEEEMGIGGVAPNLRSVCLDEIGRHNAYIQVMNIMRKMYHECGLVHADLSEYNLLYYRGTVHVIDVSQSVEWDHPNAQRFLHMDASNITDHFLRMQLDTLSPEQLVEYVTEKGVTEEVVQVKERKAAPWSRASGETREEKKERKKETKEKNREKRVHKMPKKEKKKLKRKTQILKRR